MNMQAIMKQAQAMQKEIATIKEEIDNTEFVATSSFVKVKVKGSKELLEVKIEEAALEIKEDIEILEDLIVVAVNDAHKQIDKLTEEKMGKYSNMMNGMF